MAYYSFGTGPAFKTERVLRITPASLFSAAKITVGFILLTVGTASSALASASALPVASASALPATVSDDSNAPSYVQDSALKDPTEKSEQDLKLSLNTASKKAEKRSSLTFQTENDFFFSDTDQDYTNGLKVSYAFTAPEKANRLFSKMGAFVANFSPLSARAKAGGRLIYTAGIGQSIFTPDDIEATEILPQDRPYAGWAYLDFGAVSEIGDDFEAVKLEVGIVGPASLADRTQRFWHRVINSPRPAGWANQLKNEPGVNIYYTRARRLWLTATPQSQNQDTKSVQVDFLPHVTAALGNVYTYAGAGGTLRIGTNLTRDIAAPARIQPTLPGSSIHRGSGTDFYFFAGAEGRAVARNIFLDGTRRDSPQTVDSTTFVADYQIGAVFLLGPWRLALQRTWRTQEYDGSDVEQRFGSLTLTRVF